MAKYNVTYSCGHAGSVDLVGPGKDRENKIAWMERSAKCPSCFSTAKREQEAAEGPMFFMRPTQGGLEVVCYQGSFGIKDALKSRGYRFGDVYAPRAGADLMGALMARPVKGWATILKGTDAELVTKGTAEYTWITGQGAKVSIQGGLQSMLSSVIEGRPDLLPRKDSDA